MRKVVLALVTVLALAVLGVVVATLRQPEVFHVERSRSMAAPPSAVLAVAGDMARSQAWSPWADLDPEMTITHSDGTTGAGAWYAWNGNDEVGEGRLTVLSVDDRSVVSRLQFVRPFESEARTAVTAEPEGQGSRVTWSYTERPGFLSKLFGLFVDMDAMLGPDFEKGLARLEPLAVDADGPGATDQDATGEAPTVPVP